MLRACYDHFCLSGGVRATVGRSGSVLKKQLILLVLLWYATVDCSGSMLKKATAIVGSSLACRSRLLW